MRGDAEIVGFLNEVLAAELVAIDQYFLDAKLLEHWGLPGLAATFRDRAMEEMRDAERLIERILFLDGRPDVQRTGTVRIGESPREMIELGLELERAAVDRLRRGVELATERGDIGTRELFAEMLAEEEQHAAAFEAQLEAIAQVGIENYLARYVVPEST